MVSLTKNQTISLAKSSNAISRIQFGLGWDPAKKKGLFGKLLGGGDSIDLDASCVLLDAHGAVSEATVREMAAGALAQSRATIAVSVSGVAGPAGGTATKPVGMVCIGWCVRGSPPFAVTRQFSGDRESVRRQSVVVALEGVLEAVKRET